MILNSLLIVIGIFLIYIAISWGWRRYQKSTFKEMGGEIDGPTFESTMRKAQIIDLRERKDFNAGHILGARNLPYAQLKERTGELRKDLPVYLYDLNNILTIRAARRLRKAGFKEISWLKGGYDEWSGKTKKSASVY